jgi:hypothetical protein
MKITCELTHNFGSKSAEIYDMAITKHGVNL